MIRATSARTLERVKIWRGASRISFRILSSLSRLLPSNRMRLMTGFSRDLDRDDAAGLAHASHPRTARSRTGP